MTAVRVEEGELRPGVAVAVCTYCRAKGLNRFLDSLGAQQRRPEQLVIVDASPDDKTEQSLRKRPDLDALAAAVLYFRVTGPRLIWRLRTALKIVPHLRPGSYCRSGMSITWSFLPPNEELTEGQWLPGVAMWKTAVVRELGFFEGFYGYCQGEDLEFSLRAARKGSLVMAGAARVLHLHEASGRPDHFKRGYMAIYNRYQIHRRGLEDRT